ncbi:bifunctional tetrahydrofolate synthase/dihydrofolate synthase [uncultured Thiodictyon sp.]|uniref:bifunctional tetrahydrofolate synthase/dihydrofolate synthase n=1 Tax=uncultured Thiodictyon sp. TaxID=1846217 RepID=UPI0025CDB117|nr:bifunctional tetrahydrofolate synthase/dihydrofolate synthase [uncultured Thiodictyon sp.]
MNASDQWTLEEWLAWQTTLAENRIGCGLERVREVWSRLGPAQFDCLIITVGGTNGKGSCAAYLEAIVNAAGYTAGCYSSPHLLRYNERVRIGGAAASDVDLCEAFVRVNQARGTTPLTYFEFGTLAALDLFSRVAPDLVILQVGLGGRLDAVNLLDADCSVVTSIGHDHQAQLGDTLDAIALEKAGIFRADRPAIIGQPDAPAALRAAAQALGANVLQMGRELSCETATEGSGWVWTGADGERLSLPTPAMRGTFQHYNAAAAITALRVLRARLPVPMAAIRTGLGRARLPGHFQVLAGDVTWILDVAHNQEAALALATNLRGFNCPGKVRAVFGVPADKDPESVTTPLSSLVDTWYLTASGDARAMPTAQLVERLADALPGATLEVYPTVRSALDEALATSAPGDCLLVCGSFTTVGEALTHKDELSSPRMLISSLPF